MAMTAQLWTVSSLSVEFAMDRRTVARRLTEIEPVKTEGRTRFYLMKDAAPLLIAGRTDAAGDDAKSLQIAILKHRERLALAQAEGAERRNRVRADELVEKESTWREFNEFMGSIRVKIMQVPDMVAPRLERPLAAYKASAIVKARLWEVINDFARYGHQIADPETGAVLEHDGMATLADIATADGIAPHYLVAACASHFGDLAQTFGDDFELSTTATKTVSEATEIREIARCFADALEDRRGVLVHHHDRTKLVHVKEEVSYDE